MKYLLPLLLPILLAAAASSPAQYDGSVDLDESIRRQIAELEGMVGGDGSATRQSAVLLWLAELYASVGEYDHVEQCYQRIIVFFPLVTVIFGFVSKGVSLASMVVR